MDSNSLQHHGILGQKWGVRRFQNADGTLTEAGRKRYLNDSSKNASRKVIRRNKDIDEARNAIKDASRFEYELNEYLNNHMFVGPQGGVYARSNPALEKRKREVYRRMNKTLKILKKRYKDVELENRTENGKLFVDLMVQGITTSISVEND